MFKKLVCLLAAAALLLGIPGMALADDDYGRTPVNTYIADNTLYTFIKLTGTVPENIEASGALMLGTSYPVVPIASSGAGITYVLLVDGSSSLNRHYGLIKTFIETLAEKSPCAPRFVLIPYSPDPNAPIYDSVDLAAADAYAAMCGGLDSIDYRNSVNLSANGVNETIGLLQYYYPALAGSAVNLIAISDSYNDLVYDDEAMATAKALIAASPEFTFHSLIVGSDKVASEFGGKGTHRCARSASEAASAAEGILSLYNNVYRVALPIGEAIEDDYVSVNFYLRHSTGKGRDLQMFANTVEIDNVPVMCTAEDGGSLTLVQDQAKAELTDSGFESEDLCLPFVYRSAPANNGAEPIGAEFSEAAERVSYAGRSYFETEGSEAKTVTPGARPVIKPVPTPTPLPDPEETPLPSPEPSAALPSPEPSPEATPAPTATPPTRPGISGIISGGSDDEDGEPEDTEETPAPRETPVLVIVPVVTPSPAPEEQPEGTEPTEESESPETTGTASAPELGKDPAWSYKDKEEAAKAEATANTAAFEEGKDPADGRLKPEQPPVEEPVPAEAPTESETEAPTEAETEAPTEAETEAPTEAETEAPTEVETEAPTEAETEAPTEAETETPAEAETEAPTEAETEAPTEAETETPAEAETEAPTEAETEAPTESETAETGAVEISEELTDAPTEPGTQAAEVEAESSAEVAEEGETLTETKLAEENEVVVEEPASFIERFAMPMIVAAAAVLVIVVLLIARKGKKKPSNEGGIFMRLEVLSGNCKTKKADLCLSGQLLIGRDKNCDIVFADKEVSTVNSKIFIMDGFVYLEDLGSACGTYLEDMRLYDISRLRSGNEISIGNVRFRLNF